MSVLLTQPRLCPRALASRVHPATTAIRTRPPRFAKIRLFCLRNIEVAGSSPITSTGSLRRRVNADRHAFSVSGVGHRGRRTSTCAGSRDDACQTSNQSAMDPAEPEFDEPPGTPSAAVPTLPVQAERRTRPRRYRERLTSVTGGAGHERGRRPGTANRRRACGISIGDVS